MAMEINKDEYTSKLAENLVVLRSKLRLKQTDLAKKAGISRQTLMAIENQQRNMSWNTFMSLLCIFRENESTNSLLVVLDIYTSELCEYLHSEVNN
ncbi:helix-turn-helix transcriptional regulator [[Clostridium] symbiosum]|uniref:helix-turn-helix transcriptional regulator n=1 Tax=Clostridium symbiosum TaxID=1512 RepID=UPI001A9BB950|nr:helix-turn-helix domain-containing protein [[Clostridium] symbiosum]